MENVAVAKQIKHAVEMARDEAIQAARGWEQLAERYLNAPDDELAENAPYVVAQLVGTLNTTPRLAPDAQARLVGALVTALTMRES